MTDLQLAVQTLEGLVAALDASQHVSDEALVVALRSIHSQLQTNCQSAAEAMFVAIANVGAHRPHVADQFLPDAIRPLYYLGIEDLDGIKQSIAWMLSSGPLYLGQPTRNGRGYLHSLNQSEATLISAFRIMYDQEENEWRIEDTDTPNVPPILNSDPAA